VWVVAYRPRLLPFRICRRVAAPLGYRHPRPAFPFRRSEVAEPRLSPRFKVRRWPTLLRACPPPALLVRRRPAPPGVCPAPALGPGLQVPGFPVPVSPALQWLMRPQRRAMHWPMR